MTDAGSLELTLAQFAKRWNSVLDQGQYPLNGSPERNGPTFTFTPVGASDTMVVGTLNDDGTIRAVAALSVAGQKTNDIDRMMSQIEALVIWSTLGRAANPRMSEADGNMLLTDIGIHGGSDVFGMIAPLAIEKHGVRYYVVETDGATVFVATAGAGG